MKLRGILYLMLGLSACSHLKGQTVDWTKASTMDATHTTIIKDVKPSHISDASYVCGFDYEITLNSGAPFQTSSPNGYIVKTNANGDTAWCRRTTCNFTSTGSAFTPNAIAVDDNDNVYVE